MMMEEDEEILFDQAGLLTNNIKTSHNIPKPRRSCRLLRTFFLCAAFFGLGLCIAIPGPTLLDLQARTNTSTEQISRIFFGRSIGYLSGSVLGGFLFDLINQNCLLAVTLLVTAIGTVAAPWSTNYLVLMGTFALQGITMGFLDTGGNVACLHIWGRSSGPAMQALHFSFGVGAFVAPLIAEPFLSRELNATLLINGMDNSKLHSGNLALNRHVRSLDFLMRNVKLDSDNAQSTGDESTFGLSDLVRHLFKRDLTDSSPSPGDSVTDTNRAGNPRPKKPITKGDSLSQASKVADGSEIGKKLAKLPDPEGEAEDEDEEEEEDEETNMTTAFSCTNFTEVNGTQVCLDETTTQAPSTTSTVTPSTTTKQTTTLTPSTSTKTTTTTRSTIKTSLSSAGDNFVTTAAMTNQTDSKLTEIMNKVSDVFSNLQKMTKVEFAYITIAAFLFLVAFVYAFVCCCDGPCTIRSQYSSSGDSDSEYMIHKESKGFRIQILILLFIFYFLYVGMEVTYGGLIMTFTVRHLGWDKAKGTLVTSVFWGAFAIGRGLAIFIARCLSPVVMLVANLVITILSLGGLVMVLESNEQMLWFCTATLGIGMASIFPTGITWAERYMQVTGKATAVFVVGSALGEMAMPVLTGYLFDKKGPMCLMYIMLAAAIVSSIIYIIMQNLASNKGERYQRLNTLMKMAQSGDEEDDIESNVDHNHTDLQDSDSPEHHGGDVLLQNGVNRKRVTFQLPEENGVRFKRGRRNLKKTFLGRKSGKQM